MSDKVVIIVTLTILVIIIGYIIYIQTLGDGPTPSPHPIDPSPHTKPCPTDDKYLGISRPTWDTHHRSSLPDEVRDALDISLGVTVKSSREIMLTSDLPDNFDARVKWSGKIMNPMNQFNCGSCWAFATATFLADRVRIQSNKWLSEKIEIIDKKENNACIFVYNFNTKSPYFLASCDICDASNPKVRGFLVSEDECNNECQGGILQNALLYVHRHGLLAMDCYAVEKYVCTPKHDCPVFFIGPPIRVSQYDTDELSSARSYLHYSAPLADSRMDTNVRAIKSELMQNGPVLVGIIVYQSMLDQFTKSPGTVYEGPSQEENDGRGIGGHAVVVVGWAKYARGEAWIIRNSWGTTWNLNGYFRIRIGAPGLRLETDAWAAQPVLPPTSPGNNKFAFFDETPMQQDGIFKQTMMARCAEQSEHLEEYDASDVHEMGKHHMLSGIDAALLRKFHGI
jgi:hypothetical protein